MENKAQTNYYQFLPHLKTKPYIVPNLLNPVNMYSLEGQNMQTLAWQVSRFFKLVLLMPYNFIEY